MNGFAILLKRELAMAWSRGGGPAVALAFNVSAVTLLPLASGGSLEKLRLLAPGFSWVALALASLLSLERLFERDYEDGALDLLALGPAPLELVAVAKCLAQWISVGQGMAEHQPEEGRTGEAGVGQHAGEHGRQVHEQHPDRGALLVIRGHGPAEPQAGRRQDDRAGAQDRNRDARKRQEPLRIGQHRDHVSEIEGSR